MPGGGWDNLRNKDMGLVGDLSFSDCVLSDDGMYVIPKNVILYARKESAMESMSEIMEHFSNYTSSISMSINAGSSGVLDSIGISGKLSEDFQQVKSVSVRNKLQIGRTQLRYRLYSAKMQPDFKLSPALTNRLTDIVSALVNNRTKLARYLSDLIVRDFGTHAVTSVEAGGILEKLDFFQSNSITNKDFLQNKFSASMSVSFFNILGVDLGSSSTVSKEDIQEYSKSVRKTAIRSFGGPILGARPKLEDWVKTLPENLVPVDREGEPLYSVINRHSLPNMPMTHLLQLRKQIEDAVMRYYKANIVKGCMDPNSQNFDPIANVAGHCQAPANNYSFAGVYQTCEESNPGAGMDLCAGEVGGSLVNLITGKMSCPSGYDPTLLLSTVGRTGRRCWEKTRKCWLFFTCSDGVECTDSQTTLTAYWCSARRGVRLQPNSGMVYGGAYAGDGRFINDITQAKSCPEFFRAHKIGRDIYLCLSMDLSSASKHRIPFGGFFSCHSGNPMMELKSGLVSSTRFKEEATKSESPKRCPDSFSQVTLDTIDGCAVMQCIKGLSGIVRQPIRRPPFEEPDYELIEHPVLRVESHGWRWGYNANDNKWSFLGFFGSSSSETTPSSIVSSEPLSGASSKVATFGGPAPPASLQGSNSQGSQTSTAILAIVSVLAVIAVISVIVLLIRRRGSPGPRIRRVLRDLRSRRSGRRQTSPYQEVAPPDESTQPLAEDGQLNRSYGSAEVDEVACDNAEDIDEMTMDEEVVTAVQRRTTAQDV